MNLAALRAHQTRVEATPVVPSDIDAGSSIALRIRVSCASGCDLRGGLVQVVGPQQVIMTGALVDYERGATDTADLSLGIPAQAGDHSWSLRFEPQDINGIPHAGSSLPLVFRARPHDTSMIAWREESPIVAGAEFEVWVGASCAAGCELAGRLIEVSDESDCQAGEGRLGNAVWPGTRGLYVGGVRLRAPAREGVFSWTARITAPGLHPLHLTSSARFGFRTARPPECRITVEVIEDTTMLPLPECEVHSDGYQASTDERGVAKLELPKGTYEFVVRKLGYEAPPIVLEVSGDSVVRIGAHPSEERNPDDEQWM